MHELQAVTLSTYSFHLFSAPGLSHRRAISHGAVFGHGFLSIMLHVGCLSVCPLFIGTTWFQSTCVVCLSCSLPFSELPYFLFCLWSCLSHDWTANQTLIELIHLVVGKYLEFSSFRKTAPEMNIQVCKLWHEQSSLLCLELCLPLFSNPSLSLCFWATEATTRSCMQVLIVWFAAHASSSNVVGENSLGALLCRCTNGKIKALTKEALS